MRMALIANAPTVLQQATVTSAITAQGASWWHWFPTAWLIDDPAARDVEAWTAVIRAAAPTLKFLLIDLEDPSRPPIGYMNHEWYEWIAVHWP